MSTERISLEDVKHVARLSRLALTEDEAARAQGELNAILEAVVALSEVDVEGVEPTFHAVPVDAPLREDAPRESLGAERALAAAPLAEAGGFAVPKVLEVGS